MLNYVTVTLDQLEDAPWRCSEDPDDAQKMRPSRMRKFSRTQQNIVRSLQKDGQLRPIHVRPLEGTGRYQIVDGHVVVAAARQLGLQSLVAVLHIDLSDIEAQKRYIYFNFNQGGRNYVTLIRSFKTLYETSGLEERAVAVAELSELTSLPVKDLRHHIGTNEREKNWRDFDFSGDGETADEQQLSLDDTDISRA
jgi:hypothetical protein